MTTETTEAPAKTRTLHNCGCLTGTGQTCTGTTRKSFTQGHDARMASRLAQQVADGKMTMEAAEKLIREAGGGDLLVSKTKHSANLRKSGKDKASKPKASGKAKDKDAQAREEIAQALGNAGPQVKGQQVKVFHGKRHFAAVVVANAADELVARHRFQSKNCDHAVTVEDGEIFTGKAL
jgi:hypothetical protein